MWNAEQLKKKEKEKANLITHNANIDIGELIYCLTADFFFLLVPVTPSSLAVSVTFFQVSPVRGLTMCRNVISLAVSHWSLRNVQKQL